MRSIPQELLNYTYEEIRETIQTILDKNTKGTAELTALCLDPPEYKMKMTKLNPDLAGIN